jgi:hypothetical protein
MSELDGKNTRYDLEKVIECLSIDRLRTYFMFVSAEHQKLAVIPYDWLQLLSSMLFIPLQYLEITLRNKIYNILSDFYEAKDKRSDLPGVPKNWIEWMPTNPTIQKNVVYAYKNASSEIKNRSITPGDIMSRLQFIAWIKILEEHPAKKSPLYFWDFTIKEIFPNAPDWSRRAIIGELRDINTLRNRLFHYEPVWKYDNMPNFQQGIVEVSRKHKKIMAVIKWLSIDMFNFIKSSGHERRLNEAAIEIHNFLSAAEEIAERKTKYEHKEESP